MRINRMKSYCSLLGLAAVLCLSFVSAEDAKPKGKAPSTSEPGVAEAETAEATEAIPRVSLEVARDRARLMYDIYSATLHTMHQRYFHGDRAVIPARAMQDVFKEMERKNHSQSRWISASLNPMSLDHEPKTKFEKHAAKKIAKGEDFVETIDNGYYRRAGSISLGGGCVNCHAGFFRGTSGAAQFAGLVISIPVKPGAKLGDSKTRPKP